MENKERGKERGEEGRWSDSLPYLAKLTALETDARLLPTVVMMIHAGPPVSHSAGSVCVWGGLTTGTVL